MISILFHYIVLENHKTCFKETLNPWSGRLNCVERYYYCHWTKKKSSFKLTNQISFNNDTDADALKKRMNVSVTCIIYRVSNILTIDPPSNIIYLFWISKANWSFPVDQWFIAQPLYCRGIWVAWISSWWIVI